MNTLIDAIRQDCIGSTHSIDTPFGPKPLVYADYTASGRSLHSIEAFIHDRVLPCYANTHSESSFTGRQTTVLREQARQIIRTAINAGAEHRLIFCGAGATAAINKLIDALNLRLPADLASQYALHEQIPAAARPVVFIGPYEHHSNELPWRESIADVVVIPLNEDGLLDLQALQSALEEYRERELKIGSFSAASNVTGLKTDVDEVTRLLHRHDALSFWDYAAAAPYVGIDATGVIDSQGDSSKDALFISTHKFIGGPGTPGILVVKASLMTNSVPAAPGGGTVSYVTPHHHRFLADIERREEGGTPAIIESIRAGLVFKLQQDVGTETIEAREAALVKRALTRWQDVPGLEILGPLDAPRLSIVSLHFHHGDRQLHYGFVVALLNDLFGIQARGGCSCAGPYGHQLLGLDRDYSEALEQQIVAGQMILRPGWVRVNFNYFIDDTICDYLLDAVELIARHGWRLLPCYEFDADRGVWQHLRDKVTIPTSLHDFKLAEADSRAGRDAPTPAPSLRDCRRQARVALTASIEPGAIAGITLPPAAEALRWFLLPQEARQQLDTGAA